MLADNWIEFLHFQFARHSALVLGRGVKMSGACRGHHLYLVSHDSDSVGARLLYGARQGGLIKLFRRGHAVR